MKNFKRYALSLLPVSAALVLLLSLATTAHTQTTDLQQIQAKIKLLELQEEALEETLGAVKELVSSLLESKEYVLVPLAHHEWPIPKTALPGYVNHLLLTGVLKPEAVPAHIRSWTQRTQEFKKAAKQELQTTEQALSKTKDELSYFLDQRALLTKASAKQTVLGRWSGTYRNSKGQGGTSSMSFTRGADGRITGEEDGVAIQDATVSGNVISWKYQIPGSCKMFAGNLTISEDGTGSGSYTASGCNDNYSGNYINYKRQ